VQIRRDLSDPSPAEMVQADFDAGPEGLESFRGQRKCEAVGVESVSDLSPKQDRFCQVYVIELNGKKAAIKAGYSKKTAESQASRLLSKAKVRARVDQLKLKVEKKLEIKKENILRELHQISTTDILYLFNEDGSFKPLKEIPEAIRRSIASVEVEELFEGKGEERQHIGYTKKIKFWDKLGSLKLLGQHLKLYTDKLEVGMEESFLDLLLKARKRSEEKRQEKRTAAK